MPTPWDHQLAEFLTDLSAVQDESLDVLTRKQKALAALDLESLANLGREEEALVKKLMACVKRREELLLRAQEEGLPADSIRSLAGALRPSERGPLVKQLTEASGRARLLQHHSLTNWLLVQRTLIHLSQLLEIIATGGQLKPTYGEGGTDPARGALVDHVA